MLRAFNSFISATKRKQHFTVVNHAGVRRGFVLQLRCVALAMLFQLAKPQLKNADNSSACLRWL